MNIKWQVARDYFSLSFDRSVRCLSSAILGGGFNEINSFLNMRVDENFGGRKTDFPPPEQTIAEAAADCGLRLPVAGMMTAANMNSFMYSSRTVCGIDVYCFLTSGLSNALAAGDPADFRPQQMYSGPESSPSGTINIAVGIDCPLTDAALAEALLVSCEAKSSVLFELGVKSTASQRPATGTGTDSAIVLCSKPQGPDDAFDMEAFCGKHTMIGESIAAVVREALFESLKGDKLFN
ncbi:MAG: adenosylcobinamide amidohydrolase [Spirochaetales bacterium]|uniref:Adenosylcobinamide amidohydrolase n=1 Tax=Candidatus Thalassospirochaeta sargassi TaxID=3119039 RepID=A0AAJ1ICB5_9SPIO|nr:adenosylcobinamide amidohydrolase [Spirochaetales bacterium]